MGGVNKKTDVETTVDCLFVFCPARKKPHLYNVVNMIRKNFNAFTNFVKPLYMATYPLPTRPIKEINFDHEILQIFNGLMELILLASRTAKSQRTAAAAINEELSFMLLLTSCTIIMAPSLRCFRRRKLLLCLRLIFSHFIV